MTSTMHDPDLAGEPSGNQPDPAKPPGNAWADRLRALKNVPPVLHFVWESGPAVVSWNLAIRILAIGGLAELHGALVLLVLGHEDILDFVAAADDDDEQPGGEGIDGRPSPSGRLWPPAVRSTTRELLPYRLRLPTLAMIVRPTNWATR